MEKNNTHLAGEYFVAAELNRREFTVGITSGNAKAVDILVRKDSKHVSVQVKAIRNAKSGGWPISKTQKVEKGVVYIFVNLNCNGSDMRSPDYYICTSNEVEQAIQEFATRSIVNLSTLKKENFKDRWDKVK